MKPVKEPVKEDIRNIERDTLRNKNYRKVLYTIPDVFQLVLMTLLPGEDVPREIHPHTVQFIRIESGKGIATVDSRKYRLKPGVSLTVPMGHYHYIKNTSKTESLKFYTIYVPPNHEPGLIEKRAI